MTMQASRADFADVAATGAGERVSAPHLPRLSAVLHWLTATLVLAMFCMGVLMKQLGEGEIADALYTTHKVTGVVLLGLVVARLCYRVFAQASGRWRRGAASHPAHLALYAGLILVPLLGWAGISDFGARGIAFGLSLPAIWPEGAGYAELLFTGHAWLAFAMLGLVLVHIGIALSDFIQRGTQRGDAAMRDERASPGATDMP
jgi:cytochrome b561